MRGTSSCFSLMQVLIICFSRNSYPDTRDLSECYFNGGGKISWVCSFCFNFLDNKILLLAYKLISVHGLFFYE